MQFLENIPLHRYSTMGLGGQARWLTTAHSAAELREAITWAKGHQLPVLVLGGGSNVLFTDAGFSGLVVCNAIMGFDVVKDTPENTSIRMGAGEPWDAVVARSVDLQLSGIEALSAIPGTTGATPVQNVGAYGQEIAQTLVELEAYDTQTDTFLTLHNEACGFAYRSSIFNSSQRGRYAITSITLCLRKQPITPPLYASLQQYLDAHNSTDYSPANIRNAVIAIRREKLPDPATIPNTGSFFKNPIITNSAFEELRLTFPKIPHFTAPNGMIKIPAGWLIDQAGLKGYASHGMKTYEHNALVFVNDGAKSFSDLLAFKAEVVERVRVMFGITLQQEPETIDPSPAV